MAAPKGKLRAVTADDLPARKLTVAEAIATGDPRKVLVATRDRIAVAVDDPNAPARDLAALTKRITDIGREIEAIDARDLQEAGGHAEVGDGQFDASAV